MTQESKLYELSFVLKLADEEAQSAFVGEIKKYIEDRNGRPLDQSRMIKRRLAYPIGKEREGIFGSIKFFLKPEDIKGLEGQLKNEEGLIRYVLTAVKREMRDSGTGIKKPRRIPEKKAADIKEIDKKLEEIRGQ